LDKAPLVWRILRRLPHWLSDPRFAPLANYLQDDTQGTRAFALAQQLADVLDGYQNYRVDWLQAWAQGKDVVDAHRPLPSAQAWQAAMWRDLLVDLQAGLPQAHSGFVARSDVHLAFLQALKTWPANQAIPGLPPRLMVFGVTALPMQTLQALAALGQFIPVLMFVHNPSQEHWGHLTESWVAQGHPLLASWGKHGRDYLHALQEFDAKEVQVFIDPVKEARDAEQAPSALQQLQSAVLHMAEPPAQASELSCRRQHSVCANPFGATRGGSLARPTLGLAGCRPQLASLRHHGHGARYGGFCAAYPCGVQPSTAVCGGGQHQPCRPLGASFAKLAATAATALES